MNRLQEEKEEEDQDVSPIKPGSVKMPDKGKDYVILPTSDQVEEPDENAIRERRKKKFLIIGGIVAAIVLIIVIILCIVLLNKPKEKDEDDSKEVPDLSERLTCSLAGFTPTQIQCSNAGCEYYRTSLNSSEPRCVYKESNPYYIASKQENGDRVELELRLRNDEDVNIDKSKRDAPESNSTGKSDSNVDSEYNVKSATNPLPELLHVTISKLSNSSVRLQISEEQAGPSNSPPEDYNPTFNLTTADIGHPFFIILSRLDTGEVIFDTRTLPLVLTENLVELAAISPNKIYSNTRWMDTTSDSIAVWNSKENSNLPYFYGCDSQDRYFGVALNNTAPSKTTFNKNGADKSLVRYVMLGGDVDMLFFTGPLLADVAKQFTSAFGKAYNPPYWSLGTIVYHNPSFSLEADQYPIDTLIIYVGLVNDPAESQTINHNIQTVKPTKSYRGGDPAVLNSDGEVFLGKLEEGGLDFAGQYAAYIDYSAALDQFPSDEGTIYSDDADGYNLALNYPVNYVHNCTDNDVNNSPNIRILDSALYEGTLCLDYIHEGGSHKMIHNNYGTLQAKILFTFRHNESGLPILQMSESVSLGAGKYTAKTILVSTKEDLKQVVPSIIWYGNVGMHVVTRIDKNIADRDLITKYHKLISFLPFTSAEETTLSKLENTTQDDILIFTSQKYQFYPEWLTGFNKCSQQGDPLIREMAYNYPDDKFLKTDEFKDNFNQFMIGDKIIVAYTSIVGPQNEILAYLPQSDTWYSKIKRRVTDISFVFNETSTPSNGQISMINPAAEEYYFVRGGRILIMSKELSANEIRRGNLIETTKTRDMAVYYLLADSTEHITDTYYLVGPRSSVTVDFNVAINDTAITLNIKPNNVNTGLAFDAIYVYGLQRRISGINANDEDLSGLQYSYDDANHLLRIGSIADISSNRILLDMSYKLEIMYVDV